MHDVAGHWHQVREPIGLWQCLFGLERSLEKVDIEVVCTWVLRIAIHRALERLGSLERAGDGLPLAIPVPPCGRCHERIRVQGGRILVVGITLCESAGTLEVGSVPIRGAGVGLRVVPREERVDEGPLDLRGI